MPDRTVLAHQGDTISHRSGAVLVAVTCVRPDAAYRVSVCYGSTGAEIDQLSKSYQTETAARGMARTASLLFAGGRTVASVLDQLAAIQADADRRATLVVVEAAQDANILRASSPARYAEERLLDAVRDDLLDPATRTDRDARLAGLREHMLAAWAPEPQPVAATPVDADGTLFALFIPTMRGAA